MYLFCAVEVLILQLLIQIHLWSCGTPCPTAKKSLFVEFWNFQISRTLTQERFKCKVVVNCCHSCLKRVTVERVDTVTLGRLHGLTVSSHRLSNFDLLCFETRIFLKINESATVVPAERQVQSTTNSPQQTHNINTNRFFCFFTHKNLKNIKVCFFFFCVFYLLLSLLLLLSFLK